MTKTACSATSVYDALATALHKAEETLDHSDLIAAIDRFGMTHIPSPYAGPSIDDRFEFRDAAGDIVLVWRHLDYRNAYAARNKFVLELHRARSDRHRVTKVSYSLME